MRSQSKRGFTLIELLVVIAIIAILASILFPVFAKAREKARQTTCLSQVRQLATACQMYNQDNNGRFPGLGWAAAIAPYVGDSQKMFYCPSDAASDEGTISYGYAGILVRADMTGANEATILSPTEVGVLCDASPSKAYPTGGLVGCGGLQDPQQYEVLPAARHSGGLVMGFADGHAKYSPKAFVAADMSNAVTKAFFTASALGLIDNPAGGVGSCTVTNGGPVTIGGEYATRALITAAAEVWKVKGGNIANGYFTRGFGGGNMTAAQGKPTANYVWGTLAATDALSNPNTLIGHDAVVMIVSKNSQIPAIKALTLTNGAYQVATTTINDWAAASTGYTANSVQVYTYAATSETNGFIANRGMNAFANAAQAVQMANDLEMVDKIANDPLGVGYCSSAFLDLDRVVPLAFDAADTGMFPQSNPKYRWQLPTTVTYVWARSLYVESAGFGATLATAMDTGTIGTALKLSPLFKCSYW